MLVRREASAKRMYLLAAATADVRLFALKNHMVPEWVHWVHNDNDSGDLSLYYPLRMLIALDQRQQNLVMAGLLVPMTPAGHRPKRRPFRALSPL